MDSLNKHFGDLLRQELVEFLDDSDVFWNRAQSNGSQRLSSNRTESAHQYLDSTIFRFTNANIIEFEKGLGSDAGDL